MEDKYGHCPRIKAIKHTINYDILNDHKTLELP